MWIGFGIRNAYNVKNLIYLFGTEIRKDQRAITMIAIMIKAMMMMMMTTTRTTAAMVAAGLKQ